MREIFCDGCGKAQRIIFIEDGSNIIKMYSLYDMTGNPYSMGDNPKIHSIDLCRECGVKFITHIKNFSVAVKYSTP